jgi:hypothetical protein
VLPDYLNHRRRQNGNPNLKGDPVRCPLPDAARYMWPTAFNQILAETAGAELVEITKRQR